MPDFILENLPFILAVVVVGGIFGFAWFSARRDKRREAMSAEKAEAFFKASFPELQPHCHPENVAAYVIARSGRQAAQRKEWAKPTGFASAALARYEKAPKGELTILLDAAGKKILEFVLEPKTGALGAVRVGQGKFTVRRDRGQPPRVSYWHPEREFQWKGRGQWKFTSRVADETIDTTDRHWSDSSSSSSWSPSTTTTAAAAAGIAGLGGTFDGGGASAGWDEPGRGESPPSDSASSAGDSSSDSGSSSSTSY